MTKQITLRLSDEMHERLKATAEHERRSVHAQVLACLDRCMDEDAQGGEGDA
jgi:hypothetical protein